MPMTDQATRRQMAWRGALIAIMLPFICAGVAGALFGCQSIDGVFGGPGGMPFSVVTERPGGLTGALNAAAAVLLMYFITWGCAPLVLGAIGYIVGYNFHDIAWPKDRGSQKKLTTAQRHALIAVVTPIVSGFVWRFVWLFVLRVFYFFHLDDDGSVPWPFPMGWPSPIGLVLGILSLPIDALIGWRLGALLGGLHGKKEAGRVDDVLIAVLSPFVKSIIVGIFWLPAVFEFFEFGGATRFAENFPSNVGSLGIRVLINAVIGYALGALLDRLFGTTPGGPVDGAPSGDVHSGSDFGPEEKR
jgi:hypothetical protein